jgi:hypothetical protein
LSSYLYLCFPSVIFPLGLATKKLYLFSSLVYATCSAHLILLNWTTLMIFGQQYIWFRIPLEARMCLCMCVSMYVCMYVCMYYVRMLWAVLYRYRPCDGLIPRPRILSNCLKLFIVSEVNSESEQTKKPKLGQLKEKHEWWNEASRCAFVISFCSSLLELNILLNALFSNTLNLCFFP